MICSTCKEDKPLSDFPKNKSRSNGVASSCKACKLAYYYDNREEILSRRRELYPSSREKIQLKCKEYRAKNKESIRENDRKYYTENKDTLIKKIYDRKKNRLSNDPQFKTIELLRTRIRNAIRRYSGETKTRSCAEYGIDFVEICNHIGEKPDKNYHLDHIIPLCLFDLSNPLHVKMAHDPRNLRWVSAKENMSKNKSIQLELIESNEVLSNIYREIQNSNDCPFATNPKNPSELASGLFPG